MKKLRSFLHWLGVLFFGRTTQIVITPASSIKSFARSVTFCFVEEKDSQGRTFVSYIDFGSADYDDMTFGELPNSITLCSRGTGIILAQVRPETYEKLFTLYSRVKDGIKCKEVERHLINTKVLKVVHPMAT